MSETEEMPQTGYVGSTYTNASIESVFHAVYIPEDDNETSPENNTKENIRVYQNKVEALKVIKTYKTGRLRTFKNRAEAEEYAKTGYEQNNSVHHFPTYPLTCATEEKSNNFKGPRIQDLVCFRKLIESGDTEAVRSTVWGNPRYLISSGDTPAILKEGSRYNALHVAVKAEQPEICELILNTVGNAEFIRLLYGEEDSKSYVDRAQIMLDLYLNTPDKGLNETPLHFSVKFGLKDVVRILVSYPQCEKKLRNKYQQLPIDIICTRKCQNDEELKKEIRMLLEDQYYVPVLRSEDNTIQPVIGEPFSPTNPLSFKSDPISPRVEVRAFAGPMTKSRALEFRKKWKTPPRLQTTPIKKTYDNGLNNSELCPEAITLRLQDVEKGLERVGRTLAEEYQVSWNEYWDFLNDFADFRCTEGLVKLEKYLKKKYRDRPFYTIQKSVAASPTLGKKNNLTDNASLLTKMGTTLHYSAILTKEKNSLRGETTAVQNEDPDDELDLICNKLQSCSIAAEFSQRNGLENEEDNAEFFTPPSSPEPSRNSTDDEMEIAEEGIAMFLEGPAPTKLDFAVFNALPTTIDFNKYPNVYRWQHEMNLTMKRDSTRACGVNTIRRNLLMNY